MTQYKSFKVGGKDGIFDIATGRDVIIGRTKEGDIPLISHQHDNNGITKYIERLDDRKLFNYRNTIALADRGVFYATVQKEDFHIGTRVKALTFKSGDKSENIRLFFAASINKLQVLFDEYLSNATDKLPELSIMLPVNASGKIDYYYMESAIQKIKDDSKTNITSYLKMRGLNGSELDLDEEEAYRRLITEKVTYKNFKLGLGENRLFDISNSKKKFNANTIKFNGKHPYVARSSSNNGIRGYITQDERYLNAGKTISFGQDTATIFYQEKPYFTGDKIKIMTFIERELNSELACYLITVMRKAFKEFAWGQSSFNVNILKNIEIVLPITTDEEIDYDFMINLIRAHEKLAIANLTL